MWFVFSVLCGFGCVWVVLFVLYGVSVECVLCDVTVYVVWCFCVCCSVLFPCVLLWVGCSVFGAVCGAGGVVVCVVWFVCWCVYVVWCVHCSMFVV